MESLLIGYIFLNLISDQFQERKMISQFWSKNLYTTRLSCTISRA